jgi:adenosylmethionine---8-amino-7-oxononanoate aminotransferase
MNEFISKRDQKNIWHPFTQAKISPPPIVITHGIKSFIYTSDGKKLFDGISSWWTNSHGHCHPYISEAIAAQAKTLEHVIFANFTHEPAVRLAELLIKNNQNKKFSRIFYSDNGSTAVEVALKMAFQYWQHRKETRPYFIALKNGYHGDTFGAMAVSERSVFTKPFWPLLFKVLRTKSPCVSEIGPNHDAEELTDSAIKEFQGLLHKYDGKIAGLIVEPMLQAAGGMRVFTPGFLSGIERLCRKHNILLIADEIATGFYRTGKFFACEHENISPDIMCLAKGLTGGFLPLSATLATEEIYQAFLSENKADALLHGHSFTGNPLGCAAAIASMELFQKKETIEQIKNIVSATEISMQKFKNLKIVKNVRSIGTVAIVELISDHAGYLSNSAEKISLKCFDNGLYIRSLGNVLYLMPPLCSNTEDICWALDVLYNSIAS